jgi:alkyl hydroperoxide reductase subunit D
VTRDASSSGGGDMPSCPRRYPLSDKDDPMSPLKEFAEALPDYAKDLRLNLSSILSDQLLGDQRKYGLLLACAHGTGYRPVVAAAEAEADGKLSPEAANAARGAAAVMAMNNVYYRFVHLSSNPEYGTMPAKLRMNIIGSPGIAKEDFELFSLAVSAMNGCGMCIDSHERVLQQHGVKSETIQSAARIAAIVKAVATVHSTLQPAAVS